MYMYMYNTCTLIQTHSDMIKIFLNTNDEAVTDPGKRLGGVGEIMISLNERRGRERESECVCVRVCVHVCVCVYVCVCV